MGLPHGVSPKTFFLCTYISLYISISFMYTSFHLYIIQTSSVCFHFTLNTIGIKRSIIPSETAFKPMGLPYGVSPNSFYVHNYFFVHKNSPMYIQHSSVHKYSFVYIFTSL